MSVLVVLVMLLLVHLGNLSMLKQVAAVGKAREARKGVAMLMVKGGERAANPPTGKREHPVANLW